MKNLVTVIALSLVLGTGYAQKIKRSFTDDGRPLATVGTAFKSEKGTIVGSAMKLKTLSTFIFYNPKATEAEIEGGQYCYFSQSFYMSSDIDIDKEVDIMIKLGNGDIINTQTITKNYGKYISSSTYRCTFDYALDADQMKLASEHGLAKVRVIRGSEKLDWNLDKEGSMKILQALFAEDYSATKASDNADF